MWASVLAALSTGMQALAHMSRNVSDVLLYLGRGFRFGLSTFGGIVFLLQRPHYLVRELHFSGVYSLVIIMISGLFVGLVLALQGYYALRQYGADSALGAFVLLTLVRELGPVISALLFTSRVGSSITASIAMMKAREELDAMRVMGLNPLHRVVSPKFFGGVLSLPILCILFMLVGVLSSYGISVVVLGVDGGYFWSSVQDTVHFGRDLLSGVFKSFVFGVVVCMVAVFEGCRAHPSADGVAVATTRTVVISSLLVLVLDFLLTAFMFSG